MKTVWSRSFFPVLLTYFIDNFGLAIVYPIFTPLFLKPNYHLLGSDYTLLQRTFMLGLLIASFPLAQFFGAPILGTLSDRHGRKKVFLLTISGGIIGYLMTGLGIHIKHLEVLWAGRALTGFFAGNLTLCLAAIADISKTKEARTRNFGWVGTFGGIGFVLAILTGGSLSNPDLAPFFHPEIPFFVTGFLSAINLFLMLKFFKESSLVKHPRKMDFFKGIRNIGSAIKTKEVRWMYLIYFLFMICWVTSMQFLSAYLIDHFNVSINTITFTFVFIGITWSFANFVVNPILAGLYKSPKTFLLALFTLSVALFITLIPHEPLPVFLIHFFIATLCAALAWTNGLATISTSVSNHIQGSILGVNQSVTALATIIGPLTGGLIAGIDIEKLYLFTGSCSLLAAFLLFIHSFGIKDS